MSPTRRQAGHGGPGDLFALRSPTGVALVAATVLASTVGFLDAYMINVAVPAIGHDLHASVSELQWVLTGYLITVAALLLLAGALADHFGRRRILIVGLVVMLAASLGCAAAPTVGTLIAARLIQGVGGALVVPSSLALLNGTLRGPDRARGIGIWAGISTLGTTIGPYGGGWLVDHASWRYVFLLNVPLVAAAYWVLRHVPEVVRDADGRCPLDVIGGLLAVLGLGGVIYALTEGPALRLGRGLRPHVRSDRHCVPCGPGPGRAKTTRADAADCPVPVATVRRHQLRPPCCSTARSPPRVTWSSCNANCGWATAPPKQAQPSSRSRRSSCSSPRSSEAWLPESAHDGRWRPASSQLPADSAGCRQRDRETRTRKRSCPARSSGVSGSASRWHP